MTEAANREYHRRLFGALYDEGGLEDHLEWLTGRRPRRPSDVLGLDHMGHFGPHGCERLADAVVALRGCDPARLCELGSGFGGALRTVAEQLRERSVVVRHAVGVELVRDHCAQSYVLGARLTGFTFPAVCGSVAALPLRDGAFDVVFSAGSVPHFPDMASTLREAYRVLRPGGLLVFTEEVSLRRSPPSAEFERTHDPAVFHATTPEARSRQLRDAGFVRVELTPLVEWATELLDQRHRAATLFRGTLAEVLGTDGADAVLDTLDAALAEYRRGAVIPAEVHAWRPA